MVKKRRNSAGSCVSVENDDDHALRPAVQLSTLSLRSFARSQPKRRSNRSDSSLWFLFLLLSGLNPKPQIGNWDYSFNFPTLDKMNSQHVRTLFDPMVGEFCADTSPEVLDAFFSSKMRWRNDHELAQFAWNQQAASIELNMMLTQQPPIICGATATNNSAIGPTRSSMVDGQPADPSLIDYDAIDRYWRHDIELEKGMPMNLNPVHYGGQGCSSSELVTDATDQFERDLQLLKEKQLLQPLTHEETFRYENLSKCHYADFYRTVPSAASKRWESVASSSSSSGFSDSIHQFRPASPAKSNISNFDENEAADFFSNLAKQSLLEEGVAVEPQLQTYSNLTLCSEQSALINNASMIQPMPNGTFDNLYENTCFGLSSGIRGSGAEKQEVDEQDKDLFEGLNYNSPMAIPEAEANAAIQDLQYNDDLDEALQLREFMSMEMLGEFQHSTYFSEKRVDSPIPESLLTILPYRETSPSSGIGSMQSSSSSPNYFDETSQNSADGFRFDKLVPQPQDQFEETSGGNKFYTARKSSKCRGSVERGGVEQRKRGRQSKDEQLAQDYKLPASAEEFAAMSHMDIQAFMRDSTLTQAQKTLIKKIRRRGRNKVAARKCRERRFNDAESVVSEPQYR